MVTAVQRQHSCGALADSRKLRFVDGFEVQNGSGQRWDLWFLRLLFAYLIR
jgi:hypothetical protein